MPRHSRELETLNCGKPYVRVLADEMPAIVDCFRFFAGAARCVPGLAVGRVSAEPHQMIRRDPVGVVGSIAPWNYPLMMLGLEDRAGAGRGQHGGIEAVGEDAA